MKLTSAGFTNGGLFDTNVGSEP